MPSSEVGTAFVALYEQLRAVARAKLAGTQHVSLQATLLVHEALLRMSGRSIDSFADEHHLLAAAAQAIRHVIVDHLRQKRAAKRNGGHAFPHTENTLMLDRMLEPCGPDRADFAIDLDAALANLSEIDPDMRTIVELHVFGSIPFVEIAALMELSERTVRRRWRYAAATLRHRLDAWNQELS